MSPHDERLLRMGVVFVWLATAVASLWEFDGQSMELLAKAGITDHRLAAVLIAAGAGADFLVGFALALWPSRRVYLTALALMLAMTAVASVLDPSLWLHPLGPLTKNVPIAAALWILIRGAK
ncbi:DoxX-like family protein [Luteimonas sp. SJ-92]|uniref:DoxX-like family protein n=1 Tax=Luteimonas salinisoli TaxID=2752307 RepID=A0A853J9W4_9GAMM|nr:DoxX-like family protein [Luteimonas salinisoli]NZA25477.1 DoxX-like family protein [Luteimonas salinisoli]